MHMSDTDLTPIWHRSDTRRGLSCDKSDTRLTGAQMMRRSPPPQRLSKGS